MNRHAVFRCDGGVLSGIGHLMRCGALASRLEWLGWNCTFAVAHDTLDMARRMAPSHRLIDVGREPRREPEALAAALPDGCDLLVVDHYGWSANFETQSREVARKVFVVEDLPDRAHDCDILLDQSTCRTEAEVAPLAPDAMLLLGSRHALLRDQFRQHRPTALERRAQPDYGFRRLLVGFGGTDPAGFTVDTLDALVGIDFDIDVLAGSANPHLSEIRKRLGWRGATARLHVDEGDVAALMAACDCAIGAGGGSAWERCTVGLPALLLVTAENQREVTSGIAGVGAGRLLGGLEDLAAGMEALRPPGALRLLSDSAAQLCDGLGTIRAAAALAGYEIDRAGRACRLEAAAAEHCTLVRSWQAAPGNRRFARSPEPPSPAEHETWYRACLAAVDRILFIITAGGRPAGTLRLDQLSVAAREVSILLDPQVQGMGIGRAALSLARRVAPGCELVAEILPGNEASLRTFRGAGYRPIGGNRFVLEPSH